VHVITSYGHKQPNYMALWSVAPPTLKYNWYIVPHPGPAVAPTLYIFGLYSKA